MAKNRLDKECPTKYLQNGYGENVNQNIFDQNRLGILAGYRFSGSVRIEEGYINHILQFGRLVNGKNYFQINQGQIINSFFNF